MGTNEKLYFSFGSFYAYFSDQWVTGLEMHIYLDWQAFMIQMGEEGSNSKCIDTRKIPSFYFHYSFLLFFLPSPVFPRLILKSWAQEIPPLILPSSWDYAPLPLLCISLFSHVRLHYMFHSLYYYLPSSARMWVHKGRSELFYSQHFWPQICVFCPPTNQFSISSHPSWVFCSSVQFWHWTPGVSTDPQVKGLVP